MVGADLKISFNLFREDGNITHTSYAYRASQGKGKESGLIRQTDLLQGHSVSTATQLAAISELS